MTRKKINAAGKIEEVADETLQSPTAPMEPSPVVGAIAAEPAAPQLGLWEHFLLQIVALHIVVARFVRKRILLVDIDSHEANEMYKALRTMGLQVNAESKMIAEVRLRLRWHEQVVPLLQQSRRQYDVELTRRTAAKNGKRADHTAP